jgi:hypothetical protein
MVGNTLKVLSSARMVDITMLVRFSEPTEDITSKALSSAPTVVATQEVHFSPFMDVMKNQTNRLNRSVWSTDRLGG